MSSAKNLVVVASLAMHKVLASSESDDNEFWHRLKTAHGVSFKFNYDSKVNFMPPNDYNDDDWNKAEDSEHSTEWHNGTKEDGEKDIHDTGKRIAEQLSKILMGVPLIQTLTPRPHGIVKFDKECVYRHHQKGKANVGCQIPRHAKIGDYTLDKQRGQLSAHVIERDARNREQKKQRRLEGIATSESDSQEEVAPARLEEIFLRRHKNVQFFVDDFDNTDHANWPENYSSKVGKEFITLIINDLGKRKLNCHICIRKQEILLAVKRGESLDNVKCCATARVRVYADRGMNVREFTFDCANLVMNCTIQIEEALMEEDEFGKFVRDAPTAIAARKIIAEGKKSTEDPGTLAEKLCKACKELTCPAEDISETINEVYLLLKDDRETSKQFHKQMYEESEEEDSPEEKQSPNEENIEDVTPNQTDDYPRDKQSGSDSPRASQLPVDVVLENLKRLEDHEKAMHWYDPSSSSGSSSSDYGNKL